MKQYIVIKHMDGQFDLVDGEFNDVDDAKQYARLAAASRNDWCYDVYQKVEKQA